MARVDHTSRSPVEPAGDFGNAAAMSPDGETVFVTGRLRWDSIDHDILTAAYEADTGRELWTARSGESEYDYGSDVIAGPEAVYVAAIRQAQNEFFHSVLAYDKTGELLWEGGVDVAGIHSVALATTGDGSLILSARSSAEGDARLVALDAGTGTTVWDSRLPIELPAAIDLTNLPGGGGEEAATAFVTGRVVSEESGFDHATVAVDVQTGEALWRSTYSSPDAGHDESRDVAVSRDGTTAVTTGWVAGPDGPDAATVAYDARTGQRLWDRTYDGPSSQIDQLSSVELSPDGDTAFASGLSWNVFAQAEGVGQLFDSTALAIAYDADDGSTEWISRTHGPSGSGDNWFDSSIHPAGSRLYLTGVVGQIPTTTALDTGSGAEVWTVRQGGTEGALGSPAEIVGGPDGERVYVVGSWLERSWYDLVTLAYTA